MKIRSRAKCNACGYVSALGHKVFDLPCPMCKEPMHKIAVKQFKTRFEEYENHSNCQCERCKECSKTNHPIKLPIEKNIEQKEWNKAFDERLINVVKNGGN